MGAIFRAPTLPQTIAAWQAKKAGLPGVGSLGAMQIAEAANTSLIPQAFPGRIRTTVHAEPGPGGAGQIGNVIGVVDQPLFWWYTKGTNTYAGNGFKDIYPVSAKALHFFWKRVGEEVFFAHVSNPGTAPHSEQMQLFLDLLRANARETWTLLLSDLLHS